MKNSPDEVEQLTAFVAAECNISAVSILGHIKLIATELVCAKFHDAGELIDRYLQKLSSPRHFELTSTVSLLILTNRNARGAFLRYQALKAEKPKLQKAKAPAVLDLF